MLFSSCGHHCCIIFGLSPMGAWGHANNKPTALFGTVSLACNRWCTNQPNSSCMQWGIKKNNACWVQLSPYLDKFKKKLSARDKRRILKNKCVKGHQMVKKTISKNGKVQVLLGCMTNMYFSLGLVELVNNAFNSLMDKHVYFGKSISISSFYSSDVICFRWMWEYTGNLQGLDLLACVLVQHTLAPLPGNWLISTKLLWW